MGTVRDRGQQRLLGERLLLEPDAALENLDEQLVTGRGRVGGGDQAREAIALLGRKRPAAVAVAAVGGDVHGDGVDGRADAAAQAAEDEHARSIEVAGVGDGDPGARDHAKQLDHRPVGLPARQDHELAGVPGRPHRLDVVLKRGEVLDDEGAAHRQLDDRGAAELGQRQRDHITVARVDRDVLEAVAAFSVDQRTKAQSRERGFVAKNAVGLERRADRAAAIGINTAGGHLVEGSRIEVDERAAEAAGPVAAQGQGLAVSQHPGGEVGQPDRGVVAQGGVQAGGHDGGLGEGALGSGGRGVAVGLSDPALDASALAVEEGERGGGGDGGSRGIETAAHAGAQRGLLGSGVSGRPTQDRVEQLGGPEPELAAAHLVGVGEIDANPAAARVANGSGRHQAAEGAGDRLVGGDGEPRWQGAAALALIEDALEHGGEARLGPDGGANALDGRGSLRAAHGAEPITAHRLLGGDRERAFADGCAPLLATALAGRVTNLIAAERAGYYLNLVYCLLLMRRGHELEPRHTDLYARVLGPQRLLGGDYSSAEFAYDLEQLVDWGAVDRITEAQRLRGYKDNRRVRFRYRLTEDAVALLEWLEARLAGKLAARVRDNRDRLADVLAYLKEVRRVLDAWRGGAREPDDARRAYYLLEAIGDALGDISDELLSFRAEMVAFAHQPYDLAALREILEWLERYVALYLGRIEQLRGEIRDRLAALAAPRYRAAAAECRAAVDAERAATPRVLRRSGALREAGELLDDAERFFRHRGRLAELCRHIDDSARAVLVKMHHHVKELERRNARLDDVRATIAAVARLDSDADLAPLVNRVVASAHGRFDRRPGFGDHPVAPPVPRRHAASPHRKAKASPLRGKRGSPEDARALRAKRLGELRSWLGAILGGADTLRLSEIEGWEPGAPRRWLDVARARHLGGGADGRRRLGVSFEPVAGTATIETEAEQLEAPDCIIGRATGVAP